MATRLFWTDWRKGLTTRRKNGRLLFTGAAYADPSVIAGKGRLGGSLGCLALSQAVSKSIINAIKEGSLLYIYADDKNYLKQSSFVANTTVETQCIASLQPPRKD